MPQGEKTMNSLQRLAPIIKGVWDHSTGNPASGSSVRRWIDNRSIECNGEVVTKGTKITWIGSLIIFPKNIERRVTLV